MMNIKCNFPKMISSNFCTSKVSVIVFLMLIFLSEYIFAVWPTYRQNNQRTATTCEQPSLPLHSQWVFVPNSGPSQAWPDMTSRPEPQEGFIEYPRLKFDDVFYTVADDKSVYFGSSSDHHIYCLDAATGKVKWSFCTNGPVRFAPTLWKDYVITGSDDGNIYCIDKDKGTLSWSFKAALGDDYMLGNGSMISRWPVRTGILIEGDIAFFGAGIFPIEGEALYAFDLNKREIVWRNDKIGEVDALADVGNHAVVSPQGYLLIDEDHLYVPCGRMLPVIFDRQDGRYLWQMGLKLPGNWRTPGVYGGVYSQLEDSKLFNGTGQVHEFDKKTGAFKGTWPGQKIALMKDRAFLIVEKQLVAFDRKLYPPEGPSLEHEWYGNRTWNSTSSNLLFSKWWAKFRRNGSLYQIPPALERLDDLQDRIYETGVKINEMVINDQQNNPQYIRLSKQKESLQKQLENQTQKKEELLKVVGKWQSELDKLTEEEKLASQQLEDAIIWQKDTADFHNLMIAGNLLFAGRQGNIGAYNIDSGDCVWNEKIEGIAKGLTFTDGRLFVSSSNGNIYCFAPTQKDQPVIVKNDKTRSIPLSSESQAKQILSTAGIEKGFALLLNTDVELALALAEKSELTIFLMLTDSEKTTNAGNRIVSAGMYGKRIVVHNFKSGKLPYPAYFANLIVTNDDSKKIKIDEIVRMLKPCGGVALLSGDKLLGRDTEKLAEMNLEINQVKQWIKLDRGKLPGSDDWAHEYGTTSNTASNNDQLIKAPFRLLWFGEPGPEKMRSRHETRPGPLSVNGKMFIQGYDTILAYDIYNGIQLWEREMPGVGVERKLLINWYGERPIGSLMPAYESSNLAANQQGLFVAYQDKCFEIDQISGVTKRTFNVPEKPLGKTCRWGYVGTKDGMLYGTTTDDVAVSENIFSYNLKNGQLNWLYKGKAIRHTTVTIADGRVFFCDDKGASKSQKAKLLAENEDSRIDRKGKTVSDIRLIVCLDLKTGNKIWEKAVDVTNYVRVPAGELHIMFKDDLLVVCGAPWNSHLMPDLFAGKWRRRSLMLLSAKDGSLQWWNQIGHHSRPLIIGDKLIGEPWSYDLKTGCQLQRLNPITEKQEKWQMARGGSFCGPIVATPNAMFFRGWHIAFYDMLLDYGTAFFTGMRPACTNNIIPAGGLVLVPEGAAYCLCPFPVQTTVALKPEKENPHLWGRYSLAGDIKPVKQLRINLGAPGDRLDEAGNLWLSYPRPTGDPFILKLGLKAKLTGDGGYFAQYLVDNITYLENTWLFDAGVKGLKELSIPLREKENNPADYTVKLYFALQTSAQNVTKPFDIKIQDQIAAKDVEVKKTAQNAIKTLIREFHNIAVVDNLSIELISKIKSSANSLPALMAVEFIEEKDN